MCRCALGDEERELKTADYSSPNCPEDCCGCLHHDYCEVPLELGRYSPFDDSSKASNDGFWEKEYKELQKKDDAVIAELSEYIHQLEQKLLEKSSGV